MMTNKIDFSRLVQIEETSGEDEKDTALLRKMAKDAEQFLSSFDWCKGINKGWFGWGVGGLAAVFLFELSPATPDVDRFLWVVVGDLPPAYLIVDDSPTPIEALGTYVELMEEWVTAVRAGEPVEDCIPVNSPPTR